MLLALYLGEECAVYQILDDAISNYSSTTGDHSLEVKSENLVETHFISPQKTFAPPLQREGSSVEHHSHR